jgi:hypothetical protein
VSKPHPSEPNNEFLRIILTSRELDACVGASELAEKPIEEVEAELKAAGIDLEGVIERVMSSVPGATGRSG